MKKLLLILLILFSNCLSFSLVVQNKEEFSLKPEKLSDKRIFIEYDLDMTFPFGVQYNKENYKQVSVRKSRLIEMKNSLETTIRENNTFSEYALLPKTENERDNSKYDYKISVSSNSIDSFSWYFLLYFLTIGLIPVRTTDTDYEITLKIQNAQGRVIHEQQYKNTYSFYLAIYTFLNIFEFQYSQKKFFDYQMQKIIFDLNERKLNLQ